MFWGLIMEPNKRYTQTVDKSFHVSMASLDVTTADDKMVQVMFCYEDRTYLLCSLTKGSTWQVPLDLNFQEGTKIGFTCNGQGHVHLTGYLIPEDDLDDVEEEEEEEEEEEDEDEEEQITDKQLKRKALNALKKKEKVKRTKFNTQDDESTDENADTVLNGLDDSDVSESSDKEDKSELNEDEDDEDEESEEDDEDEEEEEEEEEERPQSQKDKKNKRQQQQQKKKEENKKSVNEKETKPQQQEQKKKDGKKKMGYEKEAKQEQQPQQQNKDQKKKKGEQQQQQQQQQQQNTQNAQGEHKKRVVEGGVQVEDLKIGNGAPAKPGKFVSVYYVGRLKNGKKFDATTQGDGFKFRLGKGEVIKGWDVGIMGMKIGGKRRLTIPPAMAYGAKGSPPVIPGNSVLTFEVELRNVH